MAGIHNIIVDSGYWMALLDKKDTYHKVAVDFEEYLEHSTIIIPWPTLYETINTRLTRNRIAFEKFEEILIGRNVEFLNDKSYLKHYLEEPLWAKMRFSLVDYVIRKILQDASIRLDALFTFNSKDFADLCSTPTRPHGLEIPNEMQC